MLPQVNVHVWGHYADSFRKTLDGLSIHGCPVDFEEHDGGFFSLSFGNQNLPAEVSHAGLGGKQIPFEELGLKKVPIEDETNTNAYHVPKGSLLIYDPMDCSAKREREVISTLEIAPAVLENFSVPIPAYMHTPAHFFLTEKS